jgi:photosystem II stability/assembly factor-like uncharacterized protein
MTRPISRLLPTLLLFVVAIGQPSGQSPAPPPGQAAPPAAGPALTRELVRRLELRPVGPAAGGRIVDLAVVESAPATFYAASAGGGLWKTTDDGGAFEPIFDRESVQSIGAVAVFQPNPEIVWAGTGDATGHERSSWGDGVYKSSDGGRSWDHMGLRDSRHIARIALHPTSPDIVFVAALGHLWGPNRERGLYKSIDGGKTWRTVLFVDNDTGVVDVAIDPSDAKVMYAAAYQRRRRAWGFHGGGPGSGLYKSIDGGDTWTKVRTGLPATDKGRIGIAIARSDPRIVYVCIEQGSRYDGVSAYAERKGGVYRSLDRGETWAHMSDWNPHAMAASQIRVDPTDDQRVYMTGAFSVSVDSGRTFTTPQPDNRVEDRVVWIDPKNAAHLLKADDTGVSSSIDRGATWRPLASLPVSQVSRISVDMQAPFWIYAGMHGGSWAGPSRTANTADATVAGWRRTGDGDGFANVIDTTDNRTLYTSGAYLGLARLDMQSGTRENIRPGPRKGDVTRRDWDAFLRESDPPVNSTTGVRPANRDAPVVLSMHNPAVLYAAADDLWRSTDRGQTWGSLRDRTNAAVRSTLRVMTQLPSSSTLALDDGALYYPTITAIAESPLRRESLWVGTADGNLQLSRDTGRTWLTITNRLPDAPKTTEISAIEPSRHAELTVYVAFDGHRNDDNRNYLYRTTDGGTSWTSIEGDLPSDSVVHVIREDARNANVLYLGTERGAFVTLDRGRHWHPLGANLPRVAVHDLAIQPRDNSLIIATCGRGLWVLDSLATLQTPLPQATVSAIMAPTGQATNEGR